MWGLDKKKMVEYAYGEFFAWFLRKFACVSYNVECGLLVAGSAKESVRFCEMTLLQGKQVKKHFWKFTSI
jgi:hypothetical protein